MGPAKQLWARNGRASRVHPKELFRLHELNDHVYGTLVDGLVDAKDDFVAGAAGDGISMRLADAVALRDTTRLRQYFSAKALQAWIEADPTPPSGTMHLEIGGAQSWADGTLKNKPSV